MRAEFFEASDPERIVGSVEWTGVAADVRASDEEARLRLERVFRMSAVVVEDPIALPAGASGPAVVEPGDLDWFLAAAQVRGAQEELGVRFSSPSPGGWDPAGAYERMGDWVGRRVSRPT